jgi:hypothetical protein
MQKLDNMSVSDMPMSPLPGISEIVEVDGPVYSPGPPSYSPPLRRTRSAAEEKISQGRHPYPSDRSFNGHNVTRFPPPEPQVLDPADIALNKMVNELGFAAEDAKWALKYTDTGESLDVEAAINLLLQRVERPDVSPSSAAPAYPDEKSLARSKTTSQLPPGPPSDSDLVWRPTWRWA